MATRGSDGVFERCVKTLLIVLAVLLTGLVLRLIDLQVIHADVYRRQAAEALLLPSRTLPFVRGSILDRTGRKLVSDEPAWDIRIDYGLLAMEPGYVDAWTRRCRAQDRYGEDLDEPAVEAALRDEIQQMWTRLARFSGESPPELRRRVDRIRERVTAIRRAVARRRGFETAVAEERLAHTIVAWLDDQEQIAARHEFGRYPWVRIEATSRRRYHQADCLAHVLGRTGAVDAATMKDDPDRDDPQRRYLGNGVHGISGVEYTAEDILRGRRGRLRHDRAGQVVEDVAPQAGGDVRLTLRYDLQARLFDLLASQLPELPYSSGGSIVVLDVASRDLLALVSYPSFDPNRFRVADYYARLRSDTARMPLRFRAVANRYPPGSIIKPLTCLAGLSSGRIGLDTRLECSGHLFPDKPETSASRCWMIAGTGRRKAHGRLDVVGALEGSCNVFMYRTGIAVGVDTLCNFFHDVGFGRLSGTGLREETWGINPTPSWLNEKLGRRVTPAHARLFAIGQGEVSVTAVQAANLMATYAAGSYKHVGLIQGRGDDRQWELPVAPDHWRAIRQGLYAVVNSPFGTAVKYARFEHPRYALAGKTGSATTQPRPISYRIAYRDEQGRDMFTILPAGDRRQAITDFKALYPQVELEPGAITIQDRWPPVPPAAGGRHADAWFAGYLVPIDGDGRPLLEVMPRVAFAVLVEYGGSGGRVSGPIGRQVAEILLETLGDELDADQPVGPDAAVAGARP